MEEPTGRLVSWPRSCSGVQRIDVAISSETSSICARMLTSSSRHLALLVGDLEPDHEPSRCRWRSGRGALVVGVQHFQPRPNAQFRSSDAQLERALTDELSGPNRG